METFRICPTIGRLSYRAQIWTSVWSNNFGYFSGYFSATMAIFHTNSSFSYNEHWSRSNWWKNEEKVENFWKILKKFDKIWQNLNFGRRKIAILAWKSRQQVATTQVFHTLIIGHAQTDGKMKKKWKILEKSWQNFNLGRRNIARLAWKSRQKVATTWQQTSVNPKDHAEKNFSLISSTVQKLWTFEVSFPAICSVSPSTCPRIFTKT